MASGITDPAQLAAVEGKYMTATAGGSGLGEIASLCQLNTVLKGFASIPADTPGETKGPVTRINGQRVLKVSDTKDSAYVYVTDTAQPKLLQLIDPDADGRRPSSASAIRGRPSPSLPRPPARSSPGATKPGAGNQPPIADIGRSGCRNDGSLIPCPGSLTATAACHRSAISSSEAPPRSSDRRSLSERANRQLRTWPSAVSRTRSQDAAERPRHRRDHARPGPGRR